MSEDKKEIVRRFYAMWAGSSTIEAEEICLPTYLDHMPHTGRTHLEGLKKSVASFRVAFPDSTSVADFMMVDGDLVAGHGRFHGTHLGPLGDIPATGKRVEISTLDICRIEKGKIAEIWHLEDVMKLFEQIGVLPPKKS